MHATFLKPASSNFLAAEADLDKEGQNKSPILRLGYKSQGKYSENSSYATL